MNAPVWFRFTLILAMMACGTTGCLRRKETITVMPDGLVRVSLDFEGDYGDLRDGDAMPTEVDGWAITRTVKPQDDEQDTHVLRATRQFAAGEPLPGAYAGPGEPDGDLYLQFPTSYTKETHPDGVYHIFHRTYPEREWARTQYWQAYFVDDHHRELAERPVEDLSAGERRTLFQSFATAEAFKQAELAEAALAETHSTVPVWCSLAARQALLDSYASADMDATGDRCLAFTDEARRASCFDLETDRLHRSATEAYKSVLAEAGSFAAHEVATFDQSMARAWKRHELTGHLAGHSFEITVQMPGQLVAHNGLRVEQSDSCVKADWEFDGRAFRDRTMELVLVTREAKATDTKDRDTTDGR